MSSDHRKSWTVGHFNHAQRTQTCEVGAVASLGEPGV